ncbi:MAG: hypothetical protein NTV54_02735 [Ignavibacteriales bacterium]|nr:hypothetical protein [Ignavibacteriales bacterium]
MKARRNLFFISFLPLIICQFAYSQSDLQLFGFVQARLQKSNTNISMIADLPTPVGMQKLTFYDVPSDFISSNAQQLNLFLRKELSPSLTTWINFEFVNSYSSDKTWGSFSLEEAWLNYQYSDAVNVKVGLLIPRFNHLNEIKNRMPILPYITRPLIYESTLANTVDQTNYVPERAFLQISGNVPVSKFTLDYSVFAGHAERSFINSKVSGGMETATDSVTFKTFGGRVGVSYEGMWIGCSGSIDKDNQMATLKEIVPRKRFGIDVGINNLYGFFLDGEYVGVSLSPTKTTQDIDKIFCYGTCGYNITEQIYVYGTASFMRDKASNSLKEGMRGYNCGAGYKPIESVVVKAEYATYSGKSTFLLATAPTQPALTTHWSLKADIFQVAISVLF